MVNVDVPSILYVAWDYREKICFFLRRFKLQFLFRVEICSTFPIPRRRRFFTACLRRGGNGGGGWAISSTTLDHLDDSGGDDGGVKLKNKRIFVYSGNSIDDDDDQWKNLSGHCFLYANGLHISAIVTANCSVECVVGTMDVVFGIVAIKYKNIIQSAHLEGSLIENFPGLLHLLIGLLGNVELWIDQYRSNLINQSFTYVQAIVFDRRSRSRWCTKNGGTTAANVYNIIIPSLQNHHHTAQENSVQLSTLSLNSSCLVMDTLSRDGFVIVHSNGRVESTFNLKMLTQIIGMTHQPPSFYSRWESNFLFLATRHVHPLANVLLIIFGNVQDERTIQLELDTIYTYLATNRVGVICFLKTVDDIATMTLL